MDIEEEGCLILFETRRIFGIFGVEWKRTEATEYSSRFGLADNKNIFLIVYYFMEPIADRRASIWLVKKRKPFENANIRIQLSQQNIG